MEDKRKHSAGEAGLEQQAPPAGTEEQAAPSGEAKAAQEQEEKQGRQEAPGQEDPREAELKQLREECAALNDKYLRLMAEYDNFRKRSQRERDAIYPEATAAAVSGFLTVADNFERALAAECSDPEYKKGAELTYKSLVEALGRLRVKAFGEPGEPFDPNCHNAVMHVEDESLAPGVIAEVFQRGYRLEERVIRHAMVKVAN